MGLTLKRLYLDFLRTRYRTTESRKLRRAIIDQLCRDTGFHRKHALRVLNALPSVPNRRGRKSPCSDLARQNLRQLWLLFDQPNPRVMQRMLPLWLSSYDGRGCGPSTQLELCRMSASTIDRALNPHRAALGRKLRTGTRAGLLRYRIPIKPLGRRFTLPGYLEADTVAHCGDSMAGQFLWSLTCVGYHTRRTEVRAVWHKEASRVVQQLRDIEESVPFRVRGLSVDNGGEFMNEQLIAHLGHGPRRGGDITMTRSRPYKKNDQCYVEQKNYTHVRKLLGYERLDNPVVEAPVNDLYRNEWSTLTHFFVPQMRTIEKIRVGGKIKRKFSIPETPHQLVMKSPSVPDEIKQQMQAKFEATNPFEVRKRLHEKLKKVFELQAAFESRRN